MLFMPLRSAAFAQTCGIECSLSANAEGCDVLIGLLGVARMKARSAGPGTAFEQLQQAIKTADRSSEHAGCTPSRMYFVPVTKELPCNYTACKTCTRFFTELLSRSCPYSAQKSPYKFPGATISCPSARTAGSCSVSVSTYTKSPLCISSSPVGISSSWPRFTSMTTD